MNASDYIDAAQKYVAGYSETRPVVRHGKRTGQTKQITVNGDVVSIELSIQGTFRGPFQTPAGEVKPTGAKIDFPTADFWYLRNGKVEVFDCHIAFTTLFAQLGILPDYASAVAASAPAR